MFTRAHNDGRIIAPVSLSIDPEVIYWEGTRFSSMNAAHNLITAEQINESLEALQRINFRRAISAQWNGPITMMMVQAEVLVKTHVPLGMILDCRPF